jgi:hypothetical protein
MSGKIGPDINENGLVLSLDAANYKSYTGSGTTWRDLSDNSNNGTLTNGPTFNAANMGAIVFDGTDDKVTISMNSSFIYGVSPFSLNAWIYVLGNQSQFSAGFIWTQTISGRNYFTMGYHNSNYMFFTYGDGGGTSVFTDAGTVSQNTWINVCYSRLGTGSNQFLIYINGVQKVSGTVSYDFNNDSYTPTIGQYSHNGLPFYGKIANLSFYKSRGLTASEVLQNYNAVKSRFGL